MKRYLEPFVVDDLTRKMVFVGGPRQVGKTTLSHNIAAKDKQHAEYFNCEIDFATVIDNRLDQLIEVKQGDSSLSSSLCYYANRLMPRQAVQIVGNLGRSYDQQGIRVTSPVDFFVDPPWER